MPICILLASISLYARIPLIHLYILQLRSTYSYMSNCKVFVSMRFLKAFEDFVFDFIIAFARFESPLIYLTSTISLHSYACQRHIMSIISRFSCIIPNLTRHLYSNLESVQRTSSKSILSTLLIVDFTKALISKL
jgi:hypothetical protein